jgi:hypothetical protein
VPADLTSIADPRLILVAWAAGAGLVAGFVASAPFVGIGFTGRGRRDRLPGRAGGRTGGPVSPHYGCANDEAGTIERLTYDLDCSHHISPVIVLCNSWKSIWTVVAVAGAR